MGMRQLKITTSITNRDEGSLDKYLSDVNSAPPPMTPDQEFEAGVQAKSADKEESNIGVQKLIMHNLRFVISVAKQYKGGNHTLSTNDLVQYGNEGLIKAANRFDPTRGFKFISYAVWWIRQSIMQYISNEGRSVRLPLNQNAKVNKSRTAEAKLQQLLGREPSREEVSEEMVKMEITRELTEKMGLAPLSPEFESYMAIEFEKEMQKADKITADLSQAQGAGSRVFSLDAYVSEDGSE